MSAGPPDLFGVIDAIYGAALEPRLWEEALASAVRLFGGRECTFEVHDKHRQALSFFCDVGMPEEVRPGCGS